MQSMRWKGWKLKKRAEMKRGPHVLFFVIFFSPNWGFFFGGYCSLYYEVECTIIFMESVCILTPWFIEIWLNPKWMLRYRAKM